MRIGIDGHVIGKNIGGVERFVKELVSQLPLVAPQHEYIVFVTKSQYGLLKNDSTSKVKYVPLVFSNPLIERLLLLPWLAHRHQLDALLIQRLAPWFCGKCKLISVIHDLTPIKFPKAYTGISNKLVRLLTKNTILRSSLILTPTESIKAEITSYCSSVTAPICAFYNGVDTTRFLHDNSRINLNHYPYILAVGAIEKRKNIETIQNMLPLLNDYPNMHLKIVGGIRDQAYYQMLQNQLISLGIQQRVDYLGFSKEETLIGLYQNAQIFISASEDEGFNIPPLEAMACGTPVICSNIAVHQELFKDAAIFYETHSASDLAHKTQLLLEDTVLRDSLVTQGLSRVSFYTWNRTAKNVSKAIELLG